MNERGVMRMKRGLAGLASVGAVLAVGAFAPSAAHGASVCRRRECVDGQDPDAAHGRQLGRLHAVLRTDLEHECADDLDSYIYAVDHRETADRCPAIPPGPIVSAADFRSRT